MNNDQIAGVWHQLKGEVRNQWGKLTDDDVEKINGDMEKLAGVIQERYGKTREEAHKDIDAWFKKLSPRSIDTA